MTDYDQDKVQLSGDEAQRLSKFLLSLHSLDPIREVHEELVHWLHRLNGSDDGKS